MKRWLFAFIICCFIVNCSTNTVTDSTTSSADVSDNASAKLAETATAVSQSLNQLKAIEKASTPPINGKPLPYPTTYDMAELTSIDWSGPIEPLLKRIAFMCDYKLRIIGRRPAIPILVTISAQNTPVGYILRDANFQAATKANVNVFPAIHVIELRYGRN